MRKGMMKGSGKKGYHNVIGKDPMVHSQSAKGIKQPQKLPMAQKTLTYLRQDEWGRDVYKDKETGRIWKMTDGRPTSISKDGEPCCPMRKDIKVTYENNPVAKDKFSDLQDVSWIALSRPWLGGYSAITKDSMSVSASFFEPQDLFDLAKKFNIKEISLASDWSKWGEKGYGQKVSIEKAIKLSKLDKPKVV